MIQIGARKAILRDGVWRCAESKLEQRLNQETDRWIRETGGPGLDSADPEIDVARAIAKLCGGSVKLKVPARLKRSSSIYFARRQYSFDFSN